MINKELEQLKIGEFFADYDAESGLWCVFHTDYKTGFAFSSWASEYQAKKDADLRNLRR